MNKEKFLPVIKGILSSIVPLDRFKKPPATGGTINSRYCYAVWMRHLLAANSNGTTGVPQTVAELGPGDSIGLGLAALLSGCQKYYALDVYKYWDVERNLRIFDDLLQLFKNKTKIPSINEFPRLIPVIDNLDFPSHILNDQHLRMCLNPERLDKIRLEIIALENNAPPQYIKYFIPWNDKKIAEPSSVDLIISQAVLQYIDDLDETYSAMNTWLKKDGIMSHSIDFSSHGLTKEWNGHWTYSKTEWKLVRGKRKIILNRAPQSTHLQLNEKYNFKIVQKDIYKKENHLPGKRFSNSFKNLSEEDKTIAAMFIQSVKR